MPGAAKAWVNFNGTGTVAIRAQFNVSSITDNGAGDYTVNFTTALADANYSLVGNSGPDVNRLITSTTFLAGSIRFKVNIAGEATLQDQSLVTIAVFR
jgi:hypothetical protein